MSDTPAIRWLDLDALMREPPLPVPWLIEPLLARGHVTMLAGPAGVGKSLLAFALASAVANGTETVAGLKVTPGTVAIVDAENGERTLHERAHLADLPATQVRAGIAAAFDLRQPDAASELHRALVGEPPALLILDSLASLAPGLKENEADQAGPVLDRLRRLAQALDVALLLLHHTRKDGDSYRGGTAIPAAVDIAAVYTRPRGTTDRSRRVIDWSHERGGKMRLGPEPDPRHLRVAVEAGQLAVTAADPPSPDEAPAREPTTRDALRHAAVQHVTTSGPTAQADLLRAIGRDAKDRTGRRALDDAVHAGQLQRTEDGAYVAPGGNGATPATATRHQAGGERWQAEPRRGAATCHPATANDQTQLEPAGLSADTTDLPDVARQER